MLCHNPWVEKKTTVFGVQSASPLGVNTPQLNRPMAKGGTSRQPACALARARALGLDARPRQAPETGRSLRRVGRSRSPGAVVSADQLRPLPPVQRRRHGQHRTGLRRAARARPGRSASGRSRGRSISPEPGSSRPAIPSGSVLYYRMSKLGGGRMPRVGSQQVDERASRMIHDWIAGMPPAKAGTSDAGLAKVAPKIATAIESLRQADRLSPADRTAAIDRLASSTRGALMLLAIDRSGSALRDTAARGGRDHAE